MPGKTIPKVSAADAAVFGLALTGVGNAVWNYRAAKRSERETPPVGRFLDVDGTTLHYLRRGQGSPIVLLHGNGTMIQDWCISGVFDRLSADHDVIAFDRPGHGHSSRPRDRLWTPSAQAGLIVDALGRLGIDRATVVGHSIGSMVAAALATEHPGMVAHLVLLSGYFYPTFRIDSIVGLPAALPIIGDVLRYNVPPLLGRAVKHAMYRHMFAPAPVTPKWKREFPTGMTLRPSQVRAISADSTFMVPGAAQMADRYGEWKMPVTIVVGDSDTVVGPKGQSIRLSRKVAHSRLVVIEGAGHMVHHTDPERVTSAIAVPPPVAAAAHRTTLAA